MTEQTSGAPVGVDLSRPSAARVVPGSHLVISHATIFEPGIVHLSMWPPDAPVDVDERPERFGAFGGVARRDDAAG